MSAASGKSSQKVQKDAITETARLEQAYERMDPTNHPKIEVGKTAAEKEIDRGLMAKINLLKEKPNELGFGFRTDIENLHQFYDETLQKFMEIVKKAAAEEENDKIRAKQVEETRKKMQDLAVERAKMEKAMRERETREKALAESKKNAADKAAATNPDGTPIDPNAPKAGDRPENKSQKSKTPNKQAVSSEPIGKPGGDVPETKNTDGAALTVPGQVPANPASPDTVTPATPAGPTDPKMEPRKSMMKAKGGPETAAELALAKEAAAAAEANEQGKGKQAEMEKALENLKNLETNLTDSLEQGMSRTTVAKLSLEKAQELQSHLPAIKKSRYSNDGRYAIGITDMGGLFLFDTHRDVVKPEALKSAELTTAKLNAYLQKGNRVFRYFHVMSKAFQFQGSYYRANEELPNRIDAVFSPDSTEIFIFDCFTQVVLVYLVSEVMEFGFVEHPYYNAIREISNLSRAHAEVNPNEEWKSKLEHKVIKSRKEGEPRHVIPLRWYYNYKNPSSSADYRHEIVFMHFEKYAVGEQYFTPVDQDTLVLGTDEYVCRIIFPRFNEPLVVTHKFTEDYLPKVILHLNKCYSEIFENYNSNSEMRRYFDYNFTQSNLFYTQVKQKDLILVTVYKFVWDEFKTSDMPRIRHKRMDQIPFVMVVSRIQINSNFMLFPNTMSPSGTEIYAYNSKSNDIRSMELQTGTAVKLLAIPPNRSGVSHLVMRHHGKFLLVVDTEGWFDVYNYNNDLVEKGTKYSLLYSFFGVVEPYSATKFTTDSPEANRIHNFKLADLLPVGTGVYFFNNLNLYHYDLDLPESRIMPAINKVTNYFSFVFFNRKVDSTYEILQYDHELAVDDEGIQILERVVDLRHGNRIPRDKLFKPIKQRTLKETAEVVPKNYSDRPEEQHFVTGMESFIEKMRQVEGNPLKLLPEYTVKFFQSDCSAQAFNFEYEVNLAKKGTNSNFRLMVYRPSMNEENCVIMRLNDKLSNTSKHADSPVWSVTINLEDDPDEKYNDKDGTSEEAYQHDSDHYMWNEYQKMFNFVPISDDGNFFLAPDAPYLKVFNTDDGKVFKSLPLLRAYGPVFWLSENQVGVILTDEVEIMTNLFSEWIEKGTKLAKGLLVFSLFPKDDEKLKYKHIPLKIRDKDEEVLNYDLQNVQVYPSGYKDLRFFVVWDEVLAFDTQRLVFLFNTANVRDKQASAAQMGAIQFMPNYVYKSCSFQSSANNSVLALAPMQNATCVRLFKLPKLELLEEIKLGLGASNQAVRMCFSHDSKYFLIMTTNLTVSIYNIALEKFVEPIALPESIFKGITVLDINLVHHSKFLELSLSHKNYFLVYRIPFYPESRDLLLGALRKNFRTYKDVSQSAGSQVEQKKLAAEIAALVTMQNPHQICLDSTLLKILCCHTAKEPLETYLSSLKDKEIIFKTAQLDVLASIHEQMEEDTRNDYLGLTEKKSGAQVGTKSSLTNHVLNTFIDAIGQVHEDQKRLPEISAKTIINWLKSKSLSRRYRTKLIELVTFEPLNAVARGALQSDTGMVALIPDKTPIEKTVNFVEKFSKTLMDPESANINDYDAFITGIDFDLRNGSEFSLNYFEYLQEVSDEDLQLKYMGIIYYKWSQILYPATIYSLLYWTLNGLITAFMGFSQQSFGLGWAIIVLNVIFISYEVKGISYDWKTSWKDPWNYYDTVTHTFTMISIMILFKNPELTYDLNWLRIVSFVLISFRGVMMLRIFSGTRYLLVMLLEVFNDMVAFLSIFFWMTFAYWFMCLTRPSLTVGGSDLGLKDAIGQSLDIAFSNFNAGGLDTITLVTTVIGQILIALILLNYLISIVSKTSERISEQRELYDIKMLLDIIREFDLVFNGFRSAKEARSVRYMILRPRPTVDEQVREVLQLFDEEKVRLEGTFRQEVNKIEETVVESIETFSSKISETQKGIIELLKEITEVQNKGAKQQIKSVLKKLENMPPVVFVEKDALDIKETDKKPADQEKAEEEAEKDLYYHESSDQYNSSDQDESIEDSEEYRDDEDDEDDEDQDEDEEDSED